MNYCGARPLWGRARTPSRLALVVRMSRGPCAVQRRYGDRLRRGLSDWGNSVNETSVWRTWKPYAAIAVVAVGGIWWWNSQSSFAALKDGAYDCGAVFVNEDGKYEVLTDEAGNRMYADATVEDGDVVAVSADHALSTAELSSLTVRAKGDSHFHVTDDPAMHSYNAIACDYAG